MRRSFVKLLLCCTLFSTATASHGESGAVDPRLVLALKEAVADTRGFDNELDALFWLADKSQLLKPRVGDPFYRVKLLELIHAEATRADLEPELVLAVIEVESGFDRFAVSRSGARGLMQVMPFWKKEIGHPRDNLFYPATNLRYGCAILKYYLRRSGGDVLRALRLYNGNFKNNDYPHRVMAAFRDTWATRRVATVH